MKPLLRALALGVGPVIVVAGGWGVIGHVDEVNSLSLASSARSPLCTQSPIFKTLYKREDNGVIRVNKGYKFNGIAWLQATLCSSGVLEITASGDLAGDELPQLTVLQDDRLLGVFDIDKQITIRVEVPKPGPLYLAYLNDFYRSETRSVVLTHMKLASPNCRSVGTINVPHDTGGSWNPVHGEASLVSAVAMTIIPCSAGLFSAHLIGRKAEGLFPSVTFRQDGDMIRNVQLSSKVENVQMVISDKPLFINIDNPFFRELSDRNINIEVINFFDKAEIR